MSTMDKPSLTADVFYRQPLTNIQLLGFKIVIEAISSLFYNVIRGSFVRIKTI